VIDTDAKTLVTVDIEGKIMSYIYNLGRFKQAALLKGSEKLGVYSSDIDLAIDLGGRAIVFVELKSRGVPVNYAQKTLFTNLLKSSTVPAFFVVASHDTEPSEEICPYAVVEEVYWRHPEQGRGFDYMGFDLEYDADCLSLNHLLSALAYTYCPRLLKPSHELPDTTFLDILYKLTGMDGIKVADDLAWKRELDRTVARIGGIRRVLAFEELSENWTDDEWKAYLYELDGRLWWEKYLDTPESTEGPKEPPTVHVVF